MKNKQFPNFLIVGAAKCGTTALDGYLKQHPEVFLPEVKECRYFSNVEENNKNPYTNKDHVEFISNSNEYYDLYKGVNTPIAGDISPDYLYYYETSIKKIKKELEENTKIIILIRNPVQRAFSNYLHILREGYNSLSFDEIIEKEKDWVKTGVYYGFYVTSPGFYFKAVKHYIENFSNVKVIIFEEFIKDVNAHLIEICDFLEINNTFEFEDPAFKNKTGLPKNKVLDSIIKNKSPLKGILKKIIENFIGEKRLKNKLVRIKESNLKKPVLDDKVRVYLKNLYIEDIKELESLLEKDLSIWKK
ncbi:sulfotransferase family protein [Thalassobellus suaedae]|uniref:Sulfotransferase n=1 Tax=Thalassobellus suaedae TaxID=3074124 RepID=A0ABY9XRR0_9FLAO|nr:sulfotransferase [Flavobacteriaceae bacterium HL-DH14]